MVSAVVCLHLNLKLNPYENNVQIQMARTTTIFIITKNMVWSYYDSLTDGYSAIQVKESHVQSVPKGSSIQATIDGHTLTVVFTENLGQVNVEITTASGALVQVMWVSTPDGWQTNLLQTGDYIVTFTLSNGDEYYGEFTVTD